MAADRRAAPPSLRQSLRDLGRLARLFRGEWPALGRAGALSAVAATLGLAAPAAVAGIFDQAYPAGNVPLLGLLVAGLLAAEAGRGVVQSLSRFTAFAARVRMRDLARLALFNHVLHLPPRELERRRSGEIGARFGDLREVLDTGADGALTAMSQGVYLVAVPPVLVLIDARLALVALVSVPLTALVTAALGAVANRHWAATLAAYDDWAAFRTEAIREARTFTSMGCEAALYRRARAHVAGAHAGTVRATALWYLTGGTNALLRALNLAVLTYVGWRAVIAGSLSLGAYVAFQSYAALLLAPLATLVEAGGHLQKAAVSLGRVFELADEPTGGDPAAALVPSPRSPDARPPLDGPRLTGRLRARGLQFAYGASAPGLDLGALDLDPGQALALVGPSGCGKTTLLRMLARIERPAAGRLDAEGLDAAGRPTWRPVDTIDVAAWRRQIAACWQEPGLLSASVRDNLLVAAEGVAGRTPSDDELGAVLDACALGPRLAELAREQADHPLDARNLGARTDARRALGLDACLSEGGASLSAGERQRLALARTLLRVRVARAPIRFVLLDEATANLDGRTARAVLSRVLDELRAGDAPPAVLFVSHRAEDAALADRVLELGRPPAGHTGGDGAALAPNRLAALAVP